MSLTGEPDGPPDEERPLARRPLGRVRRGDRAARGPLARAPRRRRLRLRHLAVRDRAARADVRRHVGGEPRLRARRGRRTRRTRRSSRSRTSGPPTAGSSSPAPKQKFWERLCEALGRPELARRPALRRLRRRATATATSSLPILERATSRRGPTDEWLDAARGGRRAVRRRSTTSRRRSPIRRSRRAATSSRYEHPRSGTVRQVASPLR